MRIAVAVLAIVLAGTVAEAGKTKYAARIQPGFAFDSYSTYAWTKSLPAVHRGIQEQVVSSVERELQERGLVQVAEAEAELLVATYTYAELGANMFGASWWGSYWGIISTDIRDYAKGTLWIKVTRPGSDDGVWEAIAGKVVTGSAEKVQKKIDGIVRNMFTTKPRNPPTE
jgi:hypothetical protein